MMIEQYRNKLRRWAGCLLIAAILVMVLPRRRCERIIFLDVGQGSCTMIQNADGSTYLYDCGSNRSSMAQYVLLPCLKYYGVRTIDIVLLSHPDSDHTNGFDDLISMAEEQNIKIGALGLPAIETAARDKEFEKLYEAIEPAGIELPVRFLSTGTAWKAGKTAYRILHPTDGFSGADSNTYSLCMHVQFQGGSVLFTGDVSGEGERDLNRELQKCGIASVSVLQVSHHGSGSSTTEEFLEGIKPRAAIISVGAKNRYGHPHPDTLARLEAAGTLCYRTDKVGAIVVEGAPDILRISGTVMP